MRTIVINRTNLMVAVMALVCLASCKKDSDVVEPEVTIHEPIAGQRYDVFDTVHVLADVSDETNLVSIKVNVVNGSFTPVTYTHVIRPGGNSHRVKKELVLADVHLASGTYYVLVTASDGINENREFQEIIIDEAPLERKGVYVVTKPLGSPFLHYHNDTVLEFVYSQGGDYLASAINSWDEQILLCGMLSGDLAAYDVNDYGMRWLQVGGLNPPWNTFEGLLVHERNTYAAYYSSSIQVFDQFGTKSKTILINDDYYPSLMAVHENTMFNVQTEKVGTKSKLVLINVATGQGFQEALLDFDIRRIFIRDDKNLILFGNQNGQAVMREYSVSGNGFWEPHTFNPGPLLDATQVNANTYIVSLADGLKKYTYNPNSLVDFSLGRTFQALAYDVVRNEVIGADAGALVMMDLTTSIVTDETDAIDSIVNILPLYNK